MPRKKSAVTSSATSVSASGTLAATLEPREKRKEIRVAAQTKPAPARAKLKANHSSAKPGQTDAQPGPSRSQLSLSKARTARVPKTDPKTRTNGDSILNLHAAVNGHVTAEQVAERAYFLWLERGCPMGSAEQDWFDAEQELGLRR